MQAPCESRRDEAGPLSHLDPAGRDTAADRGVPATDSTAQGDRPARLCRRDLSGRGTTAQRLANILRTAIERRIDQRVLDHVLQQERRIRRELSKRFEGNGSAA